MTQLSIPSPLIQVSHLTKNVKVGNNTLTLLKDINFQILDGSFTIIYGPSGSGKSTLLNAIMGLDRPSSGSVVYEGKDLYKMNSSQLAYFRAYSMGIVQQTDHWVKSLNVIDNVALPLEFVGIKRQAALDAARTSLERVGLASYATKFPRVLSGGEQQRVAMARALVNNPSYIIADEPTGNLDSKNGDDLIRLLRYMNKSFQRTIVLVTHNIEYLSIADQILMIEDGLLTEMKKSSIDHITEKILKDTKERIIRWGKE